jgi:hypothetical protein
LEILQQMLEKRENNYYSPRMIALLYHGLGDVDKVFEWLNIGADEKDPRQYSTKTRLSFKNLHSDPRWSALMKKMGLEE